MKERKQQEGQNVEEKHVGESFLPFNDFASLPQVELGEERAQTLFEYEFIFKGTPASIEIVTHNETQYVEDAATPLGKVRVVRSFENGKRIVEEFPVILGVKVDIPNVETYKELQKFQVQFKLGGDHYYLRLGGIDYPDVMEHSIQRGEGGETFDYVMKDENGQEQEVLLPLNPDLLREINAKIVEKDLPITIPKNNQSI